MNTDATFRVQINDPHQPGWEPFHGFAGRRWVEGWPSLRDATRAARRCASHRRSWNVRIVNANDRPVLHIA